MKKYGFTIYTRYSGSRSRTYYVEIWRQPLRLWIAAMIYHWYDMWIYRVPGFRALERWNRSRHDSEDWFIPLSCRQDLRCYHLANKQRLILATFELTQQQYQQLRKMPARP